VPVCSVMLSLVSVNTKQQTAP